MKIVCGVLIATLLVSADLVAQARSEPFAAMALPEKWRAAGNDHPWAKPERESANRTRNTLIGLFIGAFAGGAAGWGLYNTVCEAVDNNCADSPFRLVMIGAAIGGGLGALIGSAYD